jgi:hypothetical protein
MTRILLCNGGRAGASCPRRASNTWRGLLLRLAAVVGAGRVVLTVVGGARRAGASAGRACLALTLAELAEPFAYQPFRYYRITERCRTPPVGAARDLLSHITSHAAR